VSHSRITVRDRCRTAIAGIDKHLSSEPSLTLDGESFTPTALKAKFQDLINAADATDAAKGHWSDAVQAEHLLQIAVLALLLALKSLVLLKFGKKAGAVQADFGFSPRKQAQKTVDEKALAAAKARATREKRGTLGKKQKKNIKGNVTSHTIVAGGVTGGSNGSATPAPSNAATPAHATGNGAGPSGSTL
jgi:hypothetical protein